MITLKSNSHTSSENIRMGSLALFTLLAVICLAVLAVLSISTANATMGMAQRRADATTQLYLDETAAQSFMATLDNGRRVRFTRIRVNAAKKAALQSVPEDVREQLVITTKIENRYTVTASFSCGNGRQLDITLHKEKDGTITVRRWRMMAVVNEEPTIGDLYGGF